MSQRVAPTPKLVPQTFKDFENAYHKNASPEELLRLALHAAISNPEIVQDMIRQQQLQFGRQAKAALEPNPQNAPEAIAKNKASGFKAHPSMQDYLSAATNAVRKNPNAAEVLNSFDKHAQENSKEFKNLLKNAQRLLNKPKLKNRPMPSSSKKLKPDGM